MRELGRLERAAEWRRAATENLDRRSRLPGALDAALLTPALTPTLLVHQLGIAPQTATALLRDLLAADVVHEVTGRKHFRAFAACRIRTGEAARHPENRLVAGARRGSRNQRDRASCNLEKRARCRLSSHRLSPGTQLPR